MKLNCCKVRRRFLLSSANWLIKRRLLSPSSSLESDEQILSIGADFFWGFLDISFCDFNFLFRFQNMFSESEIMIEGMVVSSKFVKLTCFKLPWWYFCLKISRNGEGTVWPPLLAPLFRIDTAGLKSTQTCRLETSHTHPSQIKLISNIIHKIFNINRIKNWRTGKYSSESEDHFYIKN